MHMPKRTLLFLLSLLLLLAACGGTQPETIEEAAGQIEDAAADLAATAEASGILETAEAAGVMETAEALAEEAAAEAENLAATAEAAGVMETAEAVAEEVAAEATKLAEESMMSADGCEAGHEGETITIYQQAGLTGALASILGDGFINGSRDAINAINEAGGVCGAELVIRLEDTQYASDQELAVYETFRAEDPKPMFVLTYASAATIALKDRVIEDHIVNIAAGLEAESFYIPADGWTVGTAPIYPDQFAGFLKWLSDNWDDVKPADAGDEIVVGVVGWANSFGAGATTDESLAYADSLGIRVLDLQEAPLLPSADVTGQVQNLLVDGANVIWAQSLSFGPAQVIGTVRALGVWDSVIVAGVNWAFNQDVVNILGENAALADGFYGVFPYLWWNDTDEPGVQRALEAFENGGYPETDKGVGYLLSYGSMFALADVLELAIDNVGFSNLDGDAFFDAMKEMGTVDAGGLFELDVRGERRTPREAQIRQMQWNGESIDFVVVEDFFELPDMRPIP